MTSPIAFTGMLTLARLTTAHAADSTVDPSISTVAAQMGDVVNAVRGEMNLPALRLDNRLCAAAGSHAAYLTRNHTISHDEDAGLPGYTAATATDRANARGYNGGCYETVSQGNLGASAVRRLFDAPYHRAPFLQPGTFEIGSGAESDIVTLMFGVTASTGVVTYPYDGQKNVPTDWDGIEAPNPMRVHPGASGQAGYVITLYHYGPTDPRLKVAAASLTTGDGKAVATYLNTPDNDDNLQNGVLLIPQQPLHPGTLYRVAVQATDSTGADCSRTWTFTTAAAAQPAPSLAHSTMTAHAATPDRSSTTVRSAVTAKTHAHTQLASAKR